MISVKICGITNARDAELCVQAGARALGFVFYGLSPRAISPATAREIGRAVPKDIKKVGVFVNSRADIIDDIAERAELDMVQLSGDEKAQDYPSLRWKIVKALRPAMLRDLEKITEWKNVQAVLIESSQQDVYGGSGVLADWKLAKEAKRFGKPIILAGGLNAATIVPAIREVQPSAVDVCSGVEAEPGKKDPKKIKGLFDALWRFDEELRAKGATSGVSGTFRSLGGIAKTLEPPKRKGADKPDEPPSDLVDEIKQ